ncbi:MAG: hypothetical protein H6898_07040 [Rhodobacter sp.]|nr:hypothetical protein [Paracoccaceae bacterium]MCC0076330.1 hypothetical protein [Rhodobacter sp.]
MRVLVLILGLGLGLLAAVAVGGRMDHLRAVGFGTSGWAGAISGDAGLANGDMAVRGGVLRWQLTGVNLSGPRWRVTLGGSDWQVQGTGRLTPATLRVVGLSGLLDASALAEALGGLVAIEGGSVTLALPDGALQAGRIDGQARGLTTAEGRFDGPVSLIAGPDGWSVTAR